MDLAYTPEQTLLRETLRKALKARYTFADRAAASRESGWRPDIWVWLAEDLDILATGFRDEGDAAIELMIIAEELGYALSLEPFVDAAAIAPAALSGWQSVRAANLRDEICRGKAITAFAWAEADHRARPKNIRSTATRVDDGWILDGKKCAVASAPLADWFLVLAQCNAAAGGMEGPAIFLLDASTTGIELASYATIDGRRAADVTFHQVPLPADAIVGVAGEGFMLLDALLDRGTTVLVAEAVGIMRRAFDDCFAYLGERRQFGQRLSDFQALQHRMADMRVQIELASAAALLAALHAGSPTHVRGRAVSAAKVIVAKALRFVGQNAVQLHGGMGMMDELAIGHAFKRLTMIAGEFGTADYHLSRYAELARA